MYERFQIAEVLKAKTLLKKDGVLAMQGDLGDKDLDGDVDADDIRALTLADARKLYRDKFWTPSDYSRFHSQQIATKVFDMAVNMGPKQAHKLLQHALNYIDWHLKIDGVLGPRTMEAANTANPLNLMAQLRREQARFYERLVDRRPHMAVFLKGWMRRARA